MAELFPSNYAHPDYASPEQLAQQRAYAAELLKRSGENVNRPTGAIANVINMLTGRLEQNRANEIQSQQAGQNARDQSALIAQLQGGQKADPNNLGAILANPMASPETRALAVHLLTMKPMEDVAGRPAYGSPVTGVQAAPITGAFQPGIRPAISAGDTSISAVPQPAPMSSGRPMPMTPTNPQGGMFGGLNFKPAGWDNQAPQAATGGGGQPPGAGLPPASAAAMRDVAGLGRELSAERIRTQGGAEAQTGVAKEDITTAATAPAVIKDLGVIKGIIQSSPGITFGPTAQMTAEAKRVIANYAPGLVDERSLAGADAIEKLNFGLAGQLARSVGGTQGELFKAIGATPGTEKSKQGTLVLIDMLQQKAQKDQQLGQLYRQFEAKGQLAAYPAAREQFLTGNPIKNPLTGRPVEMDITASRQTDASGPYEQTATNPQTKERIGLRNGRWEPIK